MDDSLCSVRKGEISERLAKINTLHPCLEFTYELEQEGKIPFLDMVIHNKSGKLTSSWYRKSTDTGLTLNYHALAPTKYKKSVVISFVHRIFRASSTWEYFHLGLEEAIGTLADNQYPSSFVMPIIRSTIEKLVCSDENQMNDSVNASIDQMNESVNDSIDSNACLYNMDEKDKFMFFVTYRGKPTEQLAMSFRKLNAPCKIVMTTRKTKTVLPSLKPNVPKMLQNAVVYKIKCPGCGSSYVGQTVRHLQRRFREHLGSNGLMRKHFETCGVQTPSSDLVEILDKSRSYVRLLTLEALWINQLKPKLNTKDEYRSRTLTLKF